MRRAQVVNNVWKRRGVFACTHDAHDDFEGSVSPYHVLREKRCFPRGCLYFRWRCRLLDRGKACKRKFQSVGRLCRGCREYEEEKIHQQPRMLLTQGQWLNFRKELEAFEDWFDQNVGREMEVTAEVAEVKPSFAREVDAGTRVRFRGFLAVLRDTYLDRTRLDSPVYLRVSRTAQERHALRRGDLLEFWSTLRQDRGRVVLERMRRLEILSRGDGQVWTPSAGLVAKQAATTFRRQPEQCLQCSAGTLLDVHQDTARGVRHFRRLLCLEGMPSPAACPQWTVSRALASGDR